LGGQLQPPKLVFEALGEGREHKFGDLEAQIAQIEHKFLTPKLTFYLNGGGDIPSAPQNGLAYRL